MIILAAISKLTTPVPRKNFLKDQHKTMFSKELKISLMSTKRNLLLFS